MRNTKAVARERATLDLIEKAESNEFYRGLADIFSDLRRGPGFSHLHNPQDADTKAKRRAVADYLNHYELVSIGILEGILDEAIYRAWMEGAFLRDWNAAARFIQRERWKKKDDGSWYYYRHHYEHYQVLVDSWSKDAISIDQLYSAPPEDDQGPGADPIPVSEGAVAEGEPESHSQHSGSDPTPP
ncbi:MAG: DUF4760 domain-containing protein [Pseudomonadota bacterium]|nr:DUF4760 domain-containing protein [Pseudomonadota bacterium]